MPRGGPTRIAGSGPLLLVFLFLLLGASAFLLPSPRPRHQRPAATRMQAAAATTSPLLQQLQAAFPSVPIPLEFVDGIAVSDSPSSLSSSGAAESGGSPEEQQALVRARTFASLAPRVLLARGLDTISDDFAFFSPSECSGFACMCVCAQPAKPLRF